MGFSLRWPFLLQGTDCRCPGFSSCNTWASAIAAPGLWRTSSVVVAVHQFSHSVVSDPLRPHGPQHTRPPCPSPTPSAYSNSCPLSREFHPTISSSVTPSPPALQSLPASWSFPVSRLFTSGGQGIGALASMYFLTIALFLELYTCIFFLIHTTQQFAINIIVLPMLKLDFKELLKNVRVTLYLQQSMGITEKLRLVRQVYLTNFCPINGLPWWLRPQTICLQ